jgi:PKD repeat protein
MRRIVTLALALAPSAATAQGPAIEHQAVKCLVVGQYGRLPACLAPAESVAQARAYFRPEGVPTWHFVKLKRLEACFEGVLPKPTKALVGRNVEYYLEGADRAFAVGRTAQHSARVVNRAEECKDEPVAAFSPKGPDAVFPSMPPGFARLGGGVGTWTVLAVVGAGVAGGGAAVAIGGDGDDPGPAPQDPPTVTPTTQPTVPSTTPPSNPPTGSALRVSCDVEPRSGLAPLRVKFRAQAIGGSGVYDFFWQFGDGGTSTQVTPGHTYESPGTYTGTVRVSSGGQTATCSRTVSADRTPGPCDTRVAPATALTSPASGSTVTGPTLMQASASASVPIERVEFHARDVVGGTSALVGIASSPPYQATWTPPASCGGGFELHSVVVDSCGGVAESSRSTVAARTDTVPPVVSSVTTQDGTPGSLDCGELVTVAAAASDNLGVASVTFFADGAPLGADTAAPFTAPWTVPTGPSAAARVLRAEARDACGNVGAGQLTVTPACQRPLTLAKAGAAGGTVVDDQTPRQIDCAPGCATDSGSYGFGSTVVLTATPAANARFAGWSGACTNPTGPCSVVMSDARAVTATFEPGTFNVTLGKTGVGTGTVSSAPAGINCGPGCTTQTAPFLAGSLVTLTAQESPNSTFTAWSGDCTGRVCQLTMDGNKNVTANFALAQFTLTVVAAGGGGGCTGVVTGTGINCDTDGTPNDCTEAFTSGTNVALTATGCFQNWSGDVPASCLAAPPPPTCTVTMDQARNVRADFSTIGAPATRGEAAPARTDSLSWLSELSVPDAAGQVYVNGQLAAAAPTGASAALLAARPDENRLEARLMLGAGRPGLWRFTLQDPKRIEPGSLRAVVGEVALVTPDTITFRLRGQPGETVAFTFRLRE